jgi:PKD repeat protein
MDIDNEVRFPKPVIIEVEQTQSDFGSEYVNLLPGEITSFHNRSYQASSFQWIFHEDASSKVSTDAVPKGISYATPGQKTLTLISTSNNGCTDTTTGNAVFVYTKPSGSDTCFGLTVTDSILEYQPEQFLQMNKVMVA